MMDVPVNPQVGLMLQHELIQIGGIRTTDRLCAALDRQRPQGRCMMRYDQRPARIVRFKKFSHPLQAPEVKPPRVQRCQSAIAAQGVSHPLVIVHTFIRNDRADFPVVEQRHVGPQCAAIDVPPFDLKKIILQHMKIGAQRLLLQAFGHSGKTIAVEFMIAADIGGGSVPAKSPDPWQPVLLRCDISRQHDQVRTQPGNLRRAKFPMQVTQNSHPHQPGNTFLVTLKIKSGISPFIADGT